MADSENVVSLLCENVRLPVSAPEEEAFRAARRMLRAEPGVGAVRSVAVHRRSIDARRKNAITFVYSVLAEAEVCADYAPKNPNVKLHPKEPLALPLGTETMPGRPVIVGFGPAGMFCALLLAECGFRPLVLERGGSVDERVRKVDAFLSGGDFDVCTNVQFGAGGAGTFSDGKLTTRIGDSRCGYVLERLHEFGAPDEILTQAKPHVGTDVLRSVVKAAERRVLDCGGEIRYHSLAERVGSDALYAGGERIPFGALVIACGHSARDLYGELLADGFAIQAKPFSAGVRIEHLQEDLNRAMYGDLAGKYGLDHADYMLSYRSGQRGVYSFCMCPGGEVIAAASEAGGVVTNGMSHHARSGRNANAALAVSVLPEDYGGTPQGAIEFQRSLERAAFAAGGGTYAAPCQTVGDFLSGGSGTAPSRILPTYRSGDVTLCDLHAILPEFITSLLGQGIRIFGGQIRGFDAADVPLTGPETRTSAPVRILRRDGVLTAEGRDRIYPCGEGAGYAGGIMSAAVDGIRVAQAILARYKRID